jgi:hypothetical protein
MQAKTLKSKALEALAAKNPGLILEWEFFKASRYPKGHQWEGQKRISARAIAKAPGVRQTYVWVHWSEPQGMWVQ